MTTLRIHAGMDLPPLPVGHKAWPLVASKPLAAPSSSPSSSPATLGADATATSHASHAHWGPGFFGLERVRVFQQAPADVQHRILERSGRDLLEEAYFIEKSGMAFAAKMVLLAETTEERMIYSRFVAEEASHFAGIRVFLHPTPESSTRNPFLQLLAGLIENGERRCLQLLVQVVLEGWGLRHYRALRDGCQSPELRSVLDGVLLDEAAHHGSGRVFVSAERMTAPEEEAALAMLVDFLKMVAVGPQATLETLEAELGPMSRAERLRTLEELGGEDHAQSRLSHLRHLLQMDSVERIVHRLESYGSFRPVPLMECA